MTARVADRQFPCEFCGRDFPRLELASFLGGLACPKCRQTFRATGACHRVATISLGRETVRARSKIRRRP
jgi:hypothetical protein